MLSDADECLEVPKDMRTVGFLALASTVLMGCARVCVKVFGKLSEILSEMFAKWESRMLNVVFACMHMILLRLW